jgi:hypothetical protein
MRLQLPTGIHHQASATRLPVAKTEKKRHVLRLAPSTTTLHHPDYLLMPPLRGAHFMHALAAWDGPHLLDHARPLPSAKKSRAI